MVDYFDPKTMPQWLEILNQMFLKKYNFLEKILINYQMAYLEQMYIRLLNLVNNHY